jgi:hypothetical protein
MTARRKKQPRTAIKKGLVFRHRPARGHARYVRIIGIRGRYSNQPIASWIEVTRANNIKRPKSEARTFLQWDGRRFWMPTAYELV